jgi:hypothetical protein
VSVQFKWPPVGRNRWPLTHGGEHTFAVARSPDQRRRTLSLDASPRKDYWRLVPPTGRTCDPMRSLARAVPVRQTSRRKELEARISRPPPCPTPVCYICARARSVYRARGAVARDGCWCAGRCCACGAPHIGRWRATADRFTYGGTLRTSPRAAHDEHRTCRLGLRRRRLRDPPCSTPPTSALAWCCSRSS